MHTPYRQPALDRLYNGFFCDDVAMLLDGRAPATGWARLLTQEPCDPAALRALATAAGTEDRVAAMAWRRLQAAGHDVPRRELFGVVIEVPLETGLDTLAAYRDGSVRYIHGSGHTSLVEGPVDSMLPLVRQLFAASQAVVDRIGPTDAPRRAAPASGVRLSFIVSDGLYFGEGPMNALMSDGLAGPVLQAGVAILDRVTSMVVA